MIIRSLISINKSATSRILLPPNNMNKIKIPPYDSVEIKYKTIEMKKAGYTTK